MRTARRGDIETLSHVLARAFDGEPVHRWILPDPRRRARLAPRLFGIALPRLLADGLVLTSNDRSGAAAWLPPGAPRRRLPRDLWVALRLALALGPGFRRAWRSAEAIERVHPADPHWYLAALGTDPPHQGRGVGSALVASVLERCDAEGVPAYLETATPDNVAFYEARGFRVRGEIAIPEGPVLWAMWRDPRAPAPRRP